MFLWLLGPRISKFRFTSVGQEVNLKIGLEKKKKSKISESMLLKQFEIKIS